VGSIRLVPGRRRALLQFDLHRRSARSFDEYGNIKFNDEKARLDNFAVQLQNAPGSQGY